ncbi:MAG: isocitrate/isopropylmalate family dehydrogenase [Pikeienuella sp.]
MTINILALGGDGIGPEILAKGLRLGEFLADRVGIELRVEYDLLHGASWGKHGSFCTQNVLEQARKANAVLVGGPE